jgi:NAD(P)-dependent dehydrogenase (short-subunit alcohol dehydrogenase family)
MHSPPTRIQWERLQQASVRSLAKAPKLEAAGPGMRVNVIAPGPIETGTLNRFTGTAENKAGLCKSPECLHLSHSAGGSSLDSKNPAQARDACRGEDFYVSRHSVLVARIGPTHLWTNRTSANLLWTHRQAH